MGLFRRSLIDIKGADPNMPADPNMAIRKPICGFGGADRKGVLGNFHRRMKHALATKLPAG